MVPMDPKLRGIHDHEECFIVAPVEYSIQKCSQVAIRERRIGRTGVACAEQHLLADLEYAPYAVESPRVLLGCLAGVPSCSQ